ncbi:MAG: terpene cyclase/mutase family protein [Akkermansiaceae bacterium]|jgi:hypothetical protein
MPLLPALLILILTLVGSAFGQAIPQREEDPVPAAVENIYTRGLRFLATSQNEQGSWDGGSGSEAGVVGLAVMAFLAHGEDPNHGPYAKNIEKAINYIIKQKKESNGYLGSSMYSHGFATLALAECYGMYRDERIAQTLKQAVDLILTAQKRNPRGGWRYSPDDTTADTSVAGCQLVALYAARNAGIPVPDAAFAKAHKYMQSCRGSNGGYGYQSAMGDRVTLTAIGVLCESLAKNHDDKLYKASAKYLAKNLNHRERHYTYYFEYYMAQALFHSSEEVWREWDAKNVRLLSTIQAPDGSFPGNHGTAFSTSGALLSLALNYRFLPIYEK